MSKRKKLTTDFNPLIELKVGDSFSGKFLGSRSVQVDGQDRLIHSFSVEGIESDIWGSAQLNQYAAKLKVGTMTYVKRTDDVPSPTFAGTKMKTYEVEIDE